MNAFQKATSWTAKAGIAVLLMSTAALPAQASPWPSDPQRNPGRIGTPAASVHCPLARLGSQLVRCDNLTGAGVTASRRIPEFGSRPGLASTMP